MAPEFEITGVDAIDNELLMVFDRRRSDPREPVRNDEETSIRRVFDLPSARSFSLTGTVRLDANADDELIDALLVGAGRSPAVTADSSAHLPGAPMSRAAAAIDGDPDTAWVTPFERQIGSWLDLGFDGSIGARAPGQHRPIERALPWGHEIDMCVPAVPAPPCTVLLCSDGDVPALVHGQGPFDRAELTGAPREAGADRVEQRLVDLLFAPLAGQEVNLANVRSPLRRMIRDFETEITDFLALNDPQNVYALCLECRAQ